MSTEPGQRYATFEALAEQFALIASRESEPPRRRWSGPKRAIAALAVVGVLTSGGLAVGGAFDSTPTGGVDPADLPLEGSPVSEAPPGFPPPGDPPPKTPENPRPSVNVIGNAVPERLLQDCRADPGSRGDCDLVLAIGAGKIEPGRYTDAELEAALKNAR